MSLVTNGYGSNQPLLMGLAEFYGEIIIVIPDDVPAEFETPTAPLILYQQNTYTGITLYLSDEWAQFLSQIQAQVFFSMKRHHYDEHPIFEVVGVLNVGAAEVTFDLTTENSDTPVSSEYRWEMMAHRLAPDFFRVMIRGRLDVKPILRRIN